jgi:hypothetical protein
MPCRRVGGIDAANLEYAQLVAGDNVHVDCVLLGVFGIRCASLEDDPLFFVERAHYLPLVPPSSKAVALLSERMLLFATYLHPRVAGR